MQPQPEGSRYYVSKGRRSRPPYGASVLSRAWLIWCCVELGEFAEARRRADEAMIIAEGAAHPFDLVVASFGLGVVALRRGDVDAGIAVLERALELCRVGHVPFSLKDRESAGRVLGTSVG